MTVKEVNVAPTLGVIGPQTVNELVPLTVTNAATESNIHSVTAGYGLVSPPSGATIDTMASSTGRRNRTRAPAVTPLRRS